MTRVKKINSFTLAEVLITLGVIGIVAAMTLPQLIRNYQHKVLETQFKKSVSVISQVVLQTKNELGIDKLAEYCSQLENTTYPNASGCYLSFFNNLSALSKKTNSYTYYVIKRYNDKILTYNGKQQITKSALAGIGEGVFQTKLMPDGSFINMYIIEAQMYIATDTNGKKGPNRLGHDIFIFTLDKNNDTLSYYSKPKNFSDEEIADKDFNTEYDKERYGNPCNTSSTQKANGVGCAYYAVRGECPEGSGRGYFECLPR